MQFVQAYGPSFLCTCSRLSCGSPPRTGWPRLLLTALWGWCPSSSSLLASALFPPSPSIISLDCAITPWGFFLGGPPFLLTYPLGAPPLPSTALPDCCDARLLAQLSPILDLPPPLSHFGSGSLCASFPDDFFSLLDLSFLPPRLRSNGTVPPFSLVAPPLAWLMTEPLFPELPGCEFRLVLPPVDLESLSGLCGCGEVDRCAVGLACPRSCLGSSHYEWIGAP